MSSWIGPQNAQFLRQDGRIIRQDGWIKGKAPTADLTLRDMEHKHHMLRLIAVASILGAGVAVYWFAPGATEMEQFQRSLQSMGGWAALVSGLLMITQAVVAPLPANVISASNGFLFGAFWGTLLSWTTTLAGASLCYYISKTFGKPVAMRFAGRALARSERFMSRYGGRAIFIVRLLPAVPFDAVSYAAGLTGVGFGRFLLASAIGSLPSSLFYAVVGSLFLQTHWWVLFAASSVSLVVILFVSRRLEARLAA